MGKEPPEVLSPQSCPLHIHLTSWISTLEYPSSEHNVPESPCLKTCAAWQAWHTNLSIASKEWGLGQVSPGEGDSRNMSIGDAGQRMWPPRQGKARVNTDRLASWRGSPLILVLVHQGPRLRTGDMYPGHPWGSSAQPGASGSCHLWPCSLWTCTR